MIGSQAAAALQPDPLDLVLGEAFLCPVVELGRSWALVRSHFLRVLERAAIGKISSYSGRSKSMAADRFGDAGRHSAPADHSPGIGLAHRVFGEHLAVVATRRAE